MERKKSTGLQSVLDALYVESMRRGTTVMFLIIAILSAGVGYLLYTYVLDSWIVSSRAYRLQVANKEIENQKTENLLAGEDQFRAEFKKVANLFEDAKPLLPEET
jgi:hypothetical protein